MSQTVEFDLDKLIGANLTPNEFTWLWCKYKDISRGDLVSSLGIDLRKLETEDWVKMTETGIILRSKFSKLIGIRGDTLEVDTWIEEWINLWPDGVKSDGISVKTDLPGITKKMKLFVKTYKGFTKNQIIEATKIYLDYKKKNGYSHIQRAHFFISKDGISNLAACVEGMVKREEKYGAEGRGQSQDL